MLHEQIGGFSRFFFVCWRIPNYNFSYQLDLRRPFICFSDSSMQSLRATIRPKPLEDAMLKKIIIDHSKCTGCLMCGQACSLVKTGTFNPAAARIRIVDWEDSGVTIPIVCQQCAEPVCIPACPQGAISKDSQTGIVRIDRDLCINCTICRQVCPYAGPVFSSIEKQVVLCDQCGGEPVCVSVCPTEALQYLEWEMGDAGQRLLAMAEIRKTLTRKERQQ